MTDGLLGVLALVVIAGGGIIVIDWLIVRKIRQLAQDSRQSGPPSELSVGEPTPEEPR